LGSSAWSARPFHRGLLGHERRDEPYTRPEHVRLALEQLGATFVKLGQILSTRSDLLGPEYQVELAGLQDAAPPVAGETIRVDPGRWRSWERPMFTFGIGAVGTLGAYVAWTARRAPRHTHL
jgi:hypothetical protein